MNKQECEKALETLENAYNVTECYESSAVVCYFAEEVGLLKQLIKEHFEPEPYKIEDLKEGMYVWDDKYKEIGLITLMICEYPHVRYCDGTMSDSKFKENRFFPASKANEGLERSK